LATYNQTLKQEKQLNGRNHHIPININTEVNGLNSPIKRHHLENWIKNEDLTIYCLQYPFYIEINTSLGLKAGRRFTNPVPPQNRQE
jgi:hypothetical protein